MRGGRASLALLVATACVRPVLAQDQSTQYSEPPPAPVTQAPLPPTTGPSPGFFNPGAAPPAAAPPQQPAITEPATAQPPPTQPPPPGPDVWLTRTVADVQALDKVSARVQTLVLQIAVPQSFGSLTLTLRACMVRPPDQPQDSAAFLDIVDSHASQPGFRGWMFASEPEVSMLESPIYDIRLNGCHS
jgi:hypothetical protein